MNRLYNRNALYVEFILCSRDDMTVNCITLFPGNITFSIIGFNIRFNVEI